MTMTIDDLKKKKDINKVAIKCMRLRNITFESVNEIGIGVYAN